MSLEMIGKWRQLCCVELRIEKMREERDTLNVRVHIVRSVKNARPIHGDFNKIFSLL